MSPLTALSHPAFIRAAVLPLTLLFAATPASAGTPANARIADTPLAAAPVQLVETTGLAPTAFLGLPRFETPDGVGFPFVYAGGNLASDPGSAEFIVVPCDHLFDQVIGAPCGGAAEDRLMQELAAGSVNPFLKADGRPYPALGRAPQLVERFDLSPRTSVSIYRRE